MSIRLYGLQKGVLTLAREVLRRPVAGIFVASHAFVTRNPTRTRALVDARGKINP